jgi:hypothetical protein
MLAAYPPPPMETAAKKRNSSVRTHVCLTTLCSILLLFFATVSSIKAQQSCATAIQAQQDSTILLQFFPGQSDLWISLSTDTLHYQLGIFTESGLSGIDTMEVFTGNCSLLAIQSRHSNSDSSYYSEMLLNNTDYLFLLRRVDTTGILALFVVVTLFFNESFTSPTGCNLVSNSGFQDFNPQSFNYFATTTSTTGKWTFRDNILTDWQDGWGSPNLSPDAGYSQTGSNPDRSALLWAIVDANGDYLTGEAIFQDLSGLVHQNKYRLEVDLKAIDSYEYFPLFYASFTNFYQPSVPPNLPAGSSKPPQYTEYFLIPGLTTATVLSGLNANSFSTYSFPFTFNNQWYADPSNSIARLTLYPSQSSIVLDPVSQVSDASGLLIDNVRIIPDEDIITTITDCNIITASLTGSYTNVQYDWYSNASLTNLLLQNSPVFNGSSYPTPSTIWVQAIYHNGACNAVTSIVLLPLNPVPSVIAGKNNNCDGNTETYSIPAIYSSYLWSIVPANAGNIVTGAGTNQVTIQWDPNLLPFAPNHATVFVTVTNVHTCEAAFEKKVFNCCPCPINSIAYNGGTISTTVVYTGLDICVNDHLIVEGDLQFSNCTIYMGPDAVIEARNGGSVSIRSSTVSQYCEYMWQSIKATDDQSSIHVVGSTIQDGQFAIQSEMGASLTLSSNTFQNNYIAIKVNDHLPSGGTPIPNISITQCTITTTGTHLLPYQPYLWQTAYAGVLIDKVNQVTIGQSANPADRMKFSHLRFGIKITDAYVKVKGCEFENIGIDANAINTRIANQGAIHAMHRYVTYTGQPQKLLEVGSSTIGDECVVANGKIGIFAENCKVTIRGAGSSNRNQFSTMSDYAIKLINPIEGSLVSDNHIVQSRLGIWAANILQGNPSRPFGYITIADNIIDDGKFGIWSQNFSTYNYNRQIRIQNNQINLNSSLEDVYGIRVDACNGINVSGNVISRGSNNPILDDLAAKKGIWLARTKHAAIYDNIIFRMGSGIYGNGDMLNTQFFCNAFTNCWHPFYFGVLSVISNQGYPASLSNKPGWITNNVFYNPLGDKMAGTLNLVAYSIKRQWYYNANTTSEFDPSPIAASLQPYVEKNALYSNFNHSCDASSYKISAIAIEDAYERDAMLGDILNELNEYNQLPEEFTWYEKAYLFDVLSADTTLMYLNADPDYANFYYLMQNDNIGRFSSIRDLIASGEIHRAEELNAEINDTTTIGTNTRTLNAVYLRTVESDQYTFTEEEENSLMEIALQVPYFGGDAVYEARALLGLDILDYPAIPYRQKSPEQRPNRQFLVYPNPATDLLVFESADELDSRGLLQVFTTSGKLVKTQIVDAEVLRFSLNVSVLVPGIYFYTYTSPTFTTNGRFVKK